MVPLPLLLLLLGSTQAKVIDLSHDFGPMTMMSPSNPHYNRTDIKKGIQIADVFINFGKYSSGEHGGTHIDAPSHFLRDGPGLDKVPLEDTMLEGVVIDCTEEAKKEIMYGVPLKKLKQWEEEHGKIPPRAAVLFNFGYAKRFNDIYRYLNTDTPEDPYTFKTPYVTKEVADWLVDERNVMIIGIDTMSADLFKVGDELSLFPVHVKVLTNKRLLVENLADLSQLPPRNFRFFSTPVKFVGATGSQIRAFAIIGDESGSSSSRLSTPSLFMVSLVSFMVAMAR